MINFQDAPTPEALLPKIEKMWDLSANKIRAIEEKFDFTRGAPVFTINGNYVTRGWTEWTQGFQYGSAILQYDATQDKECLEAGISQTIALMATHITHMGVHDHGFNNVSTYGNLLRLMNEGRIPENTWERHFYELAIKCSGAVQAARWTTIPDTGGYIYSFNGPHSLFSDTVRSLRALSLGHKLGHTLMGEHDAKISLLERVIHHLHSTAKYNVYYGEGRDSYDISGRVVHESIFNLNDGRYRCPSTQQGYSPFSTWTRGLAWILTGFAEQLEFLDTLPATTFVNLGTKEDLLDTLIRTARATADFYIENTPTCGIPYWDTGAPGLAHMEDYLNKPADPFGSNEPVDSSAAAIAAQGFIRLGRYLRTQDPTSAEKYEKTGLKMLSTMLDAPYLSTEPDHQGLLLHSIYHQPNGWDHTPAGSKIPYGESCMWGDYHLRELALYVQRIAKNEPYYTFFT
ncbi:MAG: glycosyl hydrolase [Rhodothermales bacterium]